jgi:outer membrane receptor protein involved in Fe transport
MTQVNVMTGAPPFNDFDNERYDQPQRRSVDLSMGYQKGKWDLSGGINYLRNDQAGYREGDVFTVLNSVKTSYPSVGERSFKRYNYGRRLNVAYVASDKNRYDFSLYRGYRFQSRVADLLYSNSKSNVFTGSLINSFVYFNENTQEKNGVFDLYAVSASNRLKENVSLDQSLQYEGAQLEGLTTNTNFSYPGLREIYQETINPSANPLSAYRYKLDLTIKKEKSSFLVGYQFRYDIQKGNFEYRYRNIGGTDFLIDPLFTNKLVLQNNIHGGYFQFNGAASNLNYQVGLRAEHMNRRLSFQGSNGERLRLLNLFPSYRFDYALSEKTHLKHSFSRRIKRTNNYELNPFPEREHSETLEKGDPSLLPELSALWELGIEKKLKKGVLSFSVYHQRIKNPIQRVNNVFNDSILNRIYTNAGLAKQTGVEFNFLYRVGKRWQISVGGNTYRYDIKGSLFNSSLPFSNGSWVYVLNSTQTITLPSNWFVQLGINYLSLRATAQGEDGAFFTPNLSVKKSSTNNRWNFQINWLYMDGGLGISNRQRITTKGADFYTTTNYIYEPDQLQFSVGFNLSRKNRKIALPQSEMAEKEF